MLKTLVFIIMNISIVNAGPWLPKKSSKTLSSTTIFQHFNKVWFVNEVEKSIDQIQYLTQILSFQYGIADNFSLEVTVPYEMSIIGGKNGNTGFSDSTLKTSYQYHSSGNFAATANLQIKQPLSKYRTDVMNAFGDGQTDIALSTSIGQYHILAKSISMFYTLEAGYTMRLENPSDEIFLNYSMGISVGSKYSVGIFFNYVNSLDGYDLNTSEFSDAMAKNMSTAKSGLEEDFVKTGLQASVTLSKSLTISPFYSFNMAQSDLELRLLRA